MNGWTRYMASAVFITGFYLFIVYFLGQQTLPDPISVGQRLLRAVNLGGAWLWQPDRLSAALDSLPTVISILLITAIALVILNIMSAFLIGSVRWTRNQILILRDRYEASCWPPSVLSNLEIVTVTTSGQSETRF